MFHIKYWCLFKFFSVVFALSSVFPLCLKALGAWIIQITRVSAVLEYLILSCPCLFNPFLVSPHYVQMNIFRLISVCGPECLSNTYKTISLRDSKNKSQKENSMFKHRIGTSHLLFYTSFLAFVLTSDEV